MIRVFALATALLGLTGCTTALKPPSWHRAGVGSAETRQYLDECRERARMSVRSRMGSEYRDLADRSPGGGLPGGSDGFDLLQRDDLAVKERQLRNEMIDACMTAAGFYKR